MPVPLKHLTALFSPGRVVESVEIPVEDYFKWILGLGHKNYEPYTQPEMIRLGRVGEVSFKYTTFQLRVVPGMSAGYLVVHRDMDGEPATYITDYPEDFFSPQSSTREGTPPQGGGSNLASLLGKSARHVGGGGGQPAVEAPSSPQAASLPVGLRLFFGVEAGKVKNSRPPMFSYDTVKHQGSSYTGIFLHTYAKGCAPPVFSMISKRAACLAPVFEEDFPGQEPLLLLV